MDKCFVTSKDDIKDQKGIIRLIQGNEYELIDFNEDCCEVIDETNKKALFSRERFYGYWEI